MMSESYSTDLQVAEDLEDLVEIINESIERAERTLEKAKEIDEVRELITEISHSREELSQAEESLKQIENRAEVLLAQAQSIEEDLQDLKALPDKLIKLGISESALKTIQLILDNANAVNLDIQKSINDAHNILLESNTYLKESKKLVKQSEQIKQEFTNLYNEALLTVKDIETMMTISYNNATSGHEILQEFYFLLEKLGGVEKVKTLLKEVENTRLELKESKDELLITKQNLYAVAALDDYINNFQNIPSRRQLWRWLQKELGFVGIVVYLLSLITPERKK